MTLTIDTVAAKDLAAELGLKRSEIRQSKGVTYAATEYAREMFAANRYAVAGRGFDLRITVHRCGHVAEVRISLHELLSDDEPITVREIDTVCSDTCERAHVKPGERTRIVFRTTIDDVDDVVEESAAQPAAAAPQRERDDFYTIVTWFVPAGTPVSQCQSLSRTVALGLDDARWALTKWFGLTSEQVDAATRETGAGTWRRQVTGPDGWDVAILWRPMCGDAEAIGRLLEDGDWFTPGYYAATPTAREYIRQATQFEHV